MLVGQASDRQGHAFLGMRGGVLVELPRHRATVVTVQAQHDFLRQLGVRLQRRAMPQLKHARHQRGLTALGIEHGIETHALPRLRARGVIEQAGRVSGLAPLAVVHRQFARTAGCAFATAQIQLTGGVVAGVAGHAFFREDRLNVASKGDRGSRSPGGCAKRQRQQQTAE